MFISRLRLLPDAQKHRDFWKMSSPGYSVHQMMWGLFERRDGARRAFLYRQEVHNRRPQIVLVSEERPEEDRAESMAWQVECKTYAPKLHVGQKLAFVLRANPVRTKQDEQGRRHRHDVIMNFKRQLRDRQLPREEWPEEWSIVHEQSMLWLAARSEQAGFSLDETTFRADGYQQNVLRRPRGGRTIKISTVDMAGVLTVKDLDGLHRTLKGGVGPAKGFGCGLLLIRRV